MHISPYIFSIYNAQFALVLVLVLYIAYNWLSKYKGKRKETNNWYILLLYL